MIEVEQIRRHHYLGRGLFSQKQISRFVRNNFRFFLYRLIGTWRLSLF